MYNVYIGYDLGSLPFQFLSVYTFMIICLSQIHSIIYTFNTIKYK